MVVTLSLESSSPQCSWALLEGDDVRAHGATLERASGGFFASLTGAWPAGTRPNQILVGVGPGSFSGVRVAIAAALGMARAWNCPVIPVRSTHALGRLYPEEEWLGVFSDAKRGQVFYTSYRRGRMAEASRLVPRAELGPTAARCTLAVALGPLEGLSQAVCPSAAELARAWKDGGAEPALALEPVYLHETVVASA
ncbi:MAG: tRNA (adenosine(37)-N6)-threonylcarbamoyltransferase complex dimerization subunit type 1 TsaB [Candidatus Methylacidiphilales bacterium]|nr:tRNA (adenosine(37)-N6)-threonylcarbamoyltransferase complex dimerization subunit type 1 TsaB [Candidatus Methylacidiphilales bacterium]